MSGVQTKKDYLKGLVRNMVLYYASGNKGSMTYITPRKVSHYLNETGRRIYPGYFYDIYAILRCIAQKTNGFVSGRGDGNHNGRKPRPTIGIPTQVIVSNIDELLNECLSEVLGD